MASHSGPKLKQTGLLLAMDGASNKFTGKDANILAVWPWSVGTGSATGFGQNGDGNSRILDTNPHGARDIIWDVSNQDATSNADGGWNSSNFAVDQSKMYRFSVWIKRKVIGNGSTYLGTYGKNSAGSNIGVRWRSSTSTTTNPYGSARGWPGNANEWYLWVFHVWPYGTGTGSAHPDSGIWRTDGTQLVYENRDMVWLDGTTQAIHRTYLYYSTNTSTNQQFWDPRVEEVEVPSQEAPKLDRLIRSVSSRWNLRKKVSDTVLSLQKVYLNPSTNSFVFGASDSDKTIRIPLAANFNKLEGTISAWVKPYSYSSSNGIFVNRDDSTANATDWLWLGAWSSGSVLYFRLGQSGSCCSNDLTISSFSSYAPPNQWTYITATWKSSGTSVIYVNGKRITSRSISAIPSTSPSTYGRIGLGHDSGGTGSWNGEISKFNIYSTQLSDLEVFSNFNATRGRYGV